MLHAYLMAPVIVLLRPALLAAPPDGSPRKPPLAEIFSGKALNALLQEVLAAHAQGRRGPNVALDATLLRQVNLARLGGENFGLLKGGGSSSGPPPSRKRGCRATARKSPSWWARPSGPSSSTPPSRLRK